MRINAIMVVVFAAALATSAVAADTWKSHNYSDLGLAIDMPCEPTLQKETSATDAGPAPLVIAICELGSDATVMWSVADYRRLNVTTDADVALEGHVSGAVAGMKATLDSETKVTIGGASGREISFHVGDAVGRELLVYRDKRLLQVLALGKPPINVPVEYERAKRSIRLLP